MTLICKNNDSYMILNGNWQGHFNYSFLYNIVFNKMFIVQDYNDNVVCVEETIDEIIEKLDLKDVVFLNAPIELFNDYVLTKYEDTNKSYKEINQEITSVVEKINSIFDELQNKLTTFMESDNNFSESINKKLKNNYDKINEAIIEKDVYSVYSSLKSIKSQLKKDKILFTFIKDNIGDLKSDHILF
jgi:hypothetical protein